MAFEIGVLYKVYQRVSRLNGSIVKIIEPKALATDDRVWIRVIEGPNRFRGRSGLARKEYLVPLMSVNYGVEDDED